MARPLWSGSLAFGIVTIPVRMFSAVRDHDVHFHQISRSERKRIRYRKVTEGGSEVPADDIIKGYEIEDGRYVVFDDEELRKLAARKSRVIDIASFVRLDEIDPLFFDRPYHLLPDERGEKPYRLLVEVLAKAERVGMAQMVMHAKEHLVAVRSLDGALAVQTLRFADEVVDPEGIDGPLPSPKIAERELAMAAQLVETMTDAFKADDYRDEYRDRLKAAIAKKGHGKTLAIEADEEEADEGKVIDLMEALERSLAKRGGKAVGKAKPSTPAKPAGRSRRRAG